MKFLAIILPLAMSLISAAPASETFTLTKGYKVTIDGTSNLHSWDEKVESVSGNSTVMLNANGSYDINAVSLVMVVHSIKSDMGAAMNNNTYKALKSNVDPDITFSLDAPIKGIKPEASAQTVAANCKLTIAGVTKALMMQVKISMPQKGVIDFAGSQKIKMTDFGVQPPVALFGALVTGDEITIKFTTSFALSN
jgi:hypothetical protein